MIYGAQKPLFDMPAVPWDDVKRYIETVANADIVDMNIDASKCLFDLVRERRYRATECDPQVLRVRLRQIVNINLPFYITDGERLIFQYPLLRRSYLNDNALVVLCSILHHAYAQDDFSEAETEVADIGCLKQNNERFPRIRSIPRDSILNREALTEQIEEIYDLLRVLAARDS
jgi:hypothetical protein